MAALFRVLHGGTLRRVINMKVKELGVLRNLKTMKVMDGGSLRLVANFVQNMSVTITGNASNLPNYGNDTGLCTANVTGGLAPYSYAWTEDSDPDGINATISSPTNAVTKFTRTTSNDGLSIFRVTVTDALGTTATDTIPATWVSP